MLFFYLYLWHLFGSHSSPGLKSLGVFCDLNKNGWIFLGVAFILTPCFVAGIFGACYAIGGEHLCHPFVNGTNS